MDLCYISPPCEPKAFLCYRCLDQVDCRSTFLSCFATVFTDLCKIGLYIFLCVPFHSFLP